MFKDGKVTEAQQYALDITKLGQMITASSYDQLSLLVGWSIQKLGYKLVLATQNSPLFSEAEKTILINNLRSEHKQASRSSYTYQIEGIDYITDPNKKPYGVIDQQTEADLNTFRTAANSVTWKPDAVKELFYNSAKIELSNIDLPCGSELKESKLDSGFDIKDTSQTDNFVGRTFYAIIYASMSGLNAKRCDIEKLIASL